MAYASTVFAAEHNSTIRSFFGLFAAAAASSGGSGSALGSGVFASLGSTGKSAARVPSRFVPHFQQASKTSSIASPQLGHVHIGFPKIRAPPVAFYFV
jgi:hypothetical protein